MIDLLNALIWVWVITFSWMMQHYVLLSPLAILSLICYPLNFHVNRKLWRIDSIDHEANPIHRIIMGRFGVEKGMKIHASIFGGIFVSIIVLQSFLISPQHFLDIFIILMVPILAILSPIAVFVLVNDYYALRKLEKTDQASFIVKR